MSSYQTVVVGTDGSESSLRAVERAAEVAAGARAQLVLVCVYDPVPARVQAVLSRQIADPRFDRVVGREAAEEALEAAARQAERAGASEATAVLAEGDPAQALLGAAGEHDADLVVVGNRGINTMSGRLLGSVPVDMAHRSPCNVLIVHTIEGVRR
jgi:nucleotide-binding universal stress UspA family protein